MAYFDKGNKTTRIILLKKFDCKCAYCGDELSIDTLHIDHIIPLRRTKYPRFSDPDQIKGENTLENCNPACLTCNCSKSYYDLEEWRGKMYEDYDRIGVAFPRYKILKKLGLIVETYNPIVFYFEKHNNG